MVNNYTENVLNSVISLIYYPYIDIIFFLKKIEDNLLKYYMLKYDLGENIFINIFR